ncbi:Protein CBFA2T3 [Amphibalanus amphitrite]|uniref:Protein CBFA2T3 n=1 Tax=Amphibalanus amphitrite TaxID=1232801 RepID=A0A6A4VZZ3_AMPAM|nr:Protein CBFA2T3 [Amphibalanus amphitrite]
MDRRGIKAEGDVETDTGLPMSWHGRRESGSADTVGPADPSRSAASTVVSSPYTPNINKLALNGVAAPAPAGRVGTPSPPEPDLPPLRHLSKLKRFLTTLQKFGLDISEEVGERVRGLILSLVNGTLTIEEFHGALQEATHYPLRPFVVPFLRANLPLLQREMAHHARLAKLTMQQYLRQHEYMLVDPTYTAHEPSEIFSAEAHDLRKRKSSDSLAEGGADARTYSPPLKRHHSSGLHSPPFSGHLPALNGDARPMALRAVSPRDEERKPADSDEWKNIHVMLNCILSMVEKTKRALTMLQQRPADGGDATPWTRAHEPSDIRRQASEIMAQTVKATEERVAEVRRRAEDAVNEVKRQAVSELQKAVTVAEARASEIVSAERCRIEALLAEARKLGAEEALAAAGKQSDGSENCWNCGRKATETCSGCNSARYCGSFCQHKDWENHHKRCVAGPAPERVKTPPERHSESAAAEPAAPR